MRVKYIFFITIMFLFVSCHQVYDQKTVICIPVYGQSLALGEEAERITDFDSLANFADGRIVTEKLDHNYGYFDNNNLKQWGKKIIHYRKRSFELSIYRMAEELTKNTGKDTLICIFPGGQGATALANLSKGTPPYQKFIEDIKTAYDETNSNEWIFQIPAICWMQGESDIVDYPNTNYRQLLTKIWADMNDDILSITHQKDSIRFICYQTNSLSRATKFKAGNYQCPETSVPQAIVQLLQDDDRFWASGPTYPYSCVGNKIHIDAKGQQAIGTLAAKSALGIIRSKKRFCGLIPIKTAVNDSSIIIHFNVPNPPLVLDTIQVRKAKNYGFSVINKANKNIARTIVSEGGSIHIYCTEPPQGSKVRYAINGDYMKSGNQYGPRGNLRDSQGNWCYQFDIAIEQPF